MPTAMRGVAAIEPQMIYRRAGHSGVILPVLSLGLWHNFGSVDPYHEARAMVLRAFDLGITHFDLANNYGPAPGTAEETFGRILREDLAGHRDELIISTKAGYRMWPGHYGDGGSRKYLLASLEQSLKRIGVDYVDVFYHHRPDPMVPLEESMLALDHAVRQGKTLYVALSNYDPAQTQAAAKILNDLRTPVVLHQPKYNMFARDVEGGLLDVLAENGIGCIVFSPLAQGLLTDRYLDEIPADSRIAKSHGFLKADAITPQRRMQVDKLNEIAAARGQNIAQLALTWVLRDARVTSAIIGASRVSQIDSNVTALSNVVLSHDEISAIDEILASA